MSKKIFSSNMMSQVISSSNLDEAFSHVYKARLSDHSNSDIWGLSLSWQLSKLKLQDQLLAGKFQLSPVFIYNNANNLNSNNSKCLSRWSSIDAIVLKAISIVLEKVIQIDLQDNIPYHLKGTGGLKRAIVNLDQNIKQNHYIPNLNGDNQSKSNSSNSSNTRNSINNQNTSYSFNINSSNNAENTIYSDNHNNNSSNNNSSNISISSNITYNYNNSHNRRYNYVIKSDVADFYASMDHQIIIKHCEEIIKDKRIITIIHQYLNRLEICNGFYNLISLGISKGCSLSPLIGAMILKSLDKIASHKFFYARYMDDWVILTKTKSQLRRLVKLMHLVISRLNFKLALDKTYIVAGAK